MQIKNIVKIMIGGMLLVSCETISETECVAGNWSDLGYRDGVSGKSRTRIAKYVEKCGEFGQDVDRNTYLTNYETGLTHYCTYDKGFSIGENGSSYNAVCEGPQAAEFRAGYDDGHALYELHQEYERYQNNIDDTENQIADVRSRVSDPEISADEKKRLSKKLRRLKNDLKDLRWDFRHFRQEYDLDW
ncbi:MAG: hypothetical protein COA69_14390 [Robiginitomaculum sp.]|nr:MAG: hypothetical protein COA69_14390 [Robiginitomaculum sp.]